MLYNYVQTTSTLVCVVLPVSQPHRTLSESAGGSRRWGKRGDPDLRDYDLFETMSQAGSSVIGVLVWMFNHHR